jgi:hypothetical protein
MLKQMNKTSQDRSNSALSQVRNKLHDKYSSPYRQGRKSDNFASTQNSTVKKGKPPINNMKRRKSGRSIIESEFTFAGNGHGLNREEECSSPMAPLIQVGGETKNRNKTNSFQQNNEKRELDHFHIVDRNGDSLNYDIHGSIPEIVELEKRPGDHNFSFSFNKDGQSSIALDNSEDKEAAQV